MKHTFRLLYFVVDEIKIQSIPCFLRNETSKRTTDQMSNPASKTLYKSTKMHENLQSPPPSSLS